MGWILRAPMTVLPKGPPSTREDGTRTRKSPVRSGTTRDTQDCPRTRGDRGADKGRRSGRDWNPKHRSLACSGMGTKRFDRKMRTLVRDASEIEVCLQPTERQALLLENELIRTVATASRALAFPHSRAAVARASQDSAGTHSTRLGIDVPSAAANLRQSSACASSTSAWPSSPPATASRRSMRDRTGG